MALLELLAIPCALGVLLMGVIITRESWKGRK
jgi:hypothetical protein